MKKYIVSIIILFLLILSSIGGYFVYSNYKTNNSNSTETLKEKCYSEIEYLNSNIIEMMNKLNNISYTKYDIIKEEIKIDNKETEQNSSGSTKQGSEDSSNENANKNNITGVSVVENNILGDNKEIDWNNIKGVAEDIYSSWTTILIDLTTLNVNKDNLLKFNDTLDKAIKSMDDKDKNKSLIHLADLYNLLPQYLNDFWQNDEDINIYNIKSNILYAYSYVDTNNWNEVIKHIEDSKNDFSKLLNNSVNNVNNIDIVNKSYILVNELAENAKNKFKPIFYVNYSNLIEELENIN